MSAILIELYLTQDERDSLVLAVGNNDRLDGRAGYKQSKERASLDLKVRAEILKTEQAFGEKK